MITVSEREEAAILVVDIFKLLRPLAAAEITSDEVDVLEQATDRVAEVLARYRADVDRLRDELERQAAEIERLRNKKAQTCAKGDGLAEWCTDCLNAAVAAQREQDAALAQRPASLPAETVAELAILRAERSRLDEADARLREAMGNRAIEVDRARIAMNARLTEILEQMEREIAKEGVTR